MIGYFFSDAGAMPWVASAVGVGAFMNAVLTGPTSESLAWFAILVVHRFLPSCPGVRAQSITSATKLEEAGTVLLADQMRAESYFFLARTSKFTLSSVSVSYLTLIFLIVLLSATPTVIGRLSLPSRILPSRSTS